MSWLSFFIGLGTGIITTIIAILFLLWWASGIDEDDIDIPMSKEEWRR